MTGEALRELHRTRWRRAREALKLANVHDEDFATGGLGRHVEHLSVRLVVLPGDPERDTLEFDQRLWSWLRRDLGNPFEGLATDWGQQTLPTTAAAVRCFPVSADRQRWDSYLAICRHGGLDMGFGVDGGRDIDDERRAFWLLRIVGRTWAALYIYGDAVRHFGVSGPWECSVGLRRTLGAGLGNFGEGWAEYGDPRANRMTCPEPNLLWRRELDAWLGLEETRELAFSLGAWIEDSFGSEGRRFIARTGRLADQFDWQRYR